MYGGEIDFGDTSRDYDELLRRSFSKNIVFSLLDTNSDLDPELVRLLRQLDGKNVTFLVENITEYSLEHNNFSTWQFRLDPMHSAYRSWCDEDQTLVIRCFRKAGRLVVKKMFMNYVSARPNRGSEGLIHGTLMIIDREQTGDHTFSLNLDLDFLASLPKRRLDIEERLKEWRGYLDASMKVVKSKQAWVLFKELHRTGLATASVQLSKKHFSNNAEKNIHDETKVLILDAPLPKENAPVLTEESKEEPIELGTLLKNSGISSLFKGNKQQGEDFVEVEVELCQELQWDEVDSQATGKQDPLLRLPDTGLLMNSTVMDEVPISVQKKAINRLMEGQAANPRLEEFMFDITKGMSPIRSFSADPVQLVQGHLNEGQMSALNTAINARDIALIQGPPGTGKTTVIAEICNQVTLRGGRILIASQTNLAVDNALCRLGRLPHIMPIRLGKYPTEEGEEFLEDNVVKGWLNNLRQGMEENVTKKLSLRSDLEKARMEWNSYMNSRRSLEECQQKILSIESNLKKVRDSRESINEKVIIAETRISELQQEHSMLQRCSEDRSLAKGEDTLILLNRMPMIQSRLDDAIGNALRSCSGDPIERLSSLKISSLLPHIDILRNGLIQGKRRFKQLHELFHLTKFGNAQLKKLEEKRNEILGRMGKVVVKKEMMALVPELTELNQKICEEEENQGSSRINGEWTDTVDQLDPSIRSTISILRIIGIEEVFITDLESLASSIGPTDDHLATANRLSLFINELAELNPALTDSELNDLLADLFTMRKEIGKLAEQAHALRKGMEDSDEAFGKLHDDLDRSVKENERLKRSNESSHAAVFGFLKKYTDLAPGKVFMENGSNPDMDWAAVKDLIESVASSADDGISPAWTDLQAEWVNRLKNAGADDFEGMKKTYLKLANVVGVTCTESGKHKFWKDQRNFDMVIIDEVSKATPPELLMPMLLGKQIVLVGDHQQLPPIFQMSADDLTFMECGDDADASEMLARFKNLVTSSYFEEMFLKADEDMKARLTVQYRMHSAIMNAVNQFYPSNYKLKQGLVNEDVVRDHRLVLKGSDGDVTSNKAHLIWLDSSYRMMKDGPVENFETRETGNHSSRYNDFEVELMEKTLLQFEEQAIRQERPEPLDVGLITFYRGQERRIKVMVQRLKDQGRLKKVRIRFGTVDRFQGMERDIILVSLVSSPAHRSVTSFVREFRRINVAFSRAKSLLVVIGARKAFEDVMVTISCDGQASDVLCYRNIIRLAEDQSGGYAFMGGRYLV